MNIAVKYYELMTHLSTSIARFGVPCGRLVFALLAGGCLSAPGAGAAPAPAEQAPNRIVLLGARWCAPCMAEYANLPALVRAAAPDRIVLAWIDRPIAAPPGLQGQVDTMPPAAARELAERRLGVGFGLPAAVASGSACQPWRGPLRPADLPAWRAACAGQPR
ncbi:MULTISPECIES: hypothetical protein [unclassified Sphingomonas]|uniref:hypothetical protein n=1 Tax=Novosphingobium rhizosphaerae TaxID=1551649 RepID=UPI0015CAE307